MKKVLSIVLSLAMVLGSFGMAFADTTTDTTATKKISGTPSDVLDTPYEDAVTVLSALGVVSGYEDGSYQPAKVVTRAEMAKLIVAELGLEANASGSKSTFSDMAGYGWADGYVGYAQSLGIVSGYGDGTFKPGKEVSYDEALTMIVSALGYTKDAKEMNGSWPAVYVQKARALGITDDVNGGGSVGANRGDIAIYLYNTLTCVTGYADADGVFQPKKDKDQNAIYMINNLDAYEDNYRTIQGSEDALINIKQYTGSYAKTFKMSKGTYEDYIVAMGDIKSDVISGEFKASDKVLKAADGTEYKLDNIANKSWATTGTSSKVPNQVEMFVNGDSANVSFVANIGSTSSATTINTTSANGIFMSMAVDRSGKTVNGIYSISQWNANAEAVVDADDVADIKNDKSLLGKDFALNDDDAIDEASFELVGVSKLSDIKADDVVYVYTNGDKEISRIAVGNQTVKGEVTKVSKDENKVTISGKDYEYAGGALGKMVKNGINGECVAGDIESGDEVELYLDAYGYIYDYDAVSGKADNYAVVLKTEDKEGNKISSDPQLKLFINSNEAKVFSADEGDIDDTGIITTNTGVWATNAGVYMKAGTLIKYGTDKSGVIDSINASGTAVAKNGIDVRVEAANGFDISEKGYYKGYAIAKDAVIYSCDVDWSIAGTGMDDEDNYSIASLENIMDTKDVHATYAIDKNKIVAMIIWDFSSSNDIFGVPADWSTNNSDAGAWIQMLVNGAEKDYNGDKGAKAYGVAKGGTNVPGTDGLYKIKFDANGDIKELVDFATVASTDSDITSSSITITTASATTLSGKVFTDDNKKVYTLDSSVAVYVWDFSDQEYTLGSVSDLRDLRNTDDVYFYDIQGKDQVYDVVIIDQKVAR